MKHEEVGYGFFPGGDPRDFEPDPDCSTEWERLIHKEDCAALDRGETLAPNPYTSGCGNAAPGPKNYGLGAYRMKWECDGQDCPYCPPDNASLLT